MHNLQLTEDQEMVVDTVRKLVADTVAPKVQELDEHRTFVREWFDGLAELGVYGLSLTEDNGGAGMGLVPFVAALESIGEHFVLPHHLCLASEPTTFFFLSLRPQMINITLPVYTESKRRDKNFKRSETVFRGLITM